MDFLEDITPKAAAMVAIVPSLLGWWLGIHAAKPWTAFLVASLTTTAATLIGAILLVPDLATSAGPSIVPGGLIYNSLVSFAGGLGLLSGTIASVWVGKQLAVNEDFFSRPGTGAE
jgi:hypothetical protein